MADEQEQPLTVVLEATGSQPQRRIRPESYWIDSSYLVSTDAFEFVAFEGEDSTYESIDWDLRPVTLELDGQQQLIGRVEITEVGQRGSAVTCRGRDFIADLVESNVDPAFSLRDDMTLEDALLQVCGPCGITKIVDDADDYDAGKTLRQIRTGLAGAPTGKKRRRRRSDPLREYQPRPGEGVYEYINRIVSRLAITIQPGPDRGTLFITAPFYHDAPLYQPIKRYRDTSQNVGNNVISAYAVRDFTRLPSHVLVAGTAAKSGKKPEPISQAYDMFTYASLASEGQVGNIVSDRMFAGRRKPGDLTAKTGEELDADDRMLYRLFYFRDQDAREQKHLDNIATRAVAERLKDTLSYRVTLRGFKDPVTDAIWAPDRTVRVEDEVAGVFETLWIAKRTLRFDTEKGRTTELECWRPGSFPFLDETDNAI